MPVTEEEKAAKARDAALQGALTQIEREFGKGTVMRIPTRDEIQPIANEQAVVEFYSR